MPIDARTAKECFDRFGGHVRELIAATIDPRAHVLVVREAGNKATLSFRESSPVAVPIETKVGRLYFYIGQALRVEEIDAGTCRLQTHQYWYRIQEAPLLTADALLRWEYDRATARDRHARHHAQAASLIEIGGADSLDLNKIHVPTGWVTMEEVIRFLIVDLGVDPPCGERWPEVLVAAEKRFFEEFSSRFDQI